MSTMNAIEQQLQTALTAHKAGNLEAAENGYRAVLAQHPKDADAHNMLGLILMEKTFHNETPVFLIKDDAILVETLGILSCWAPLVGYLWNELLVM